MSSGIGSRRQLPPWMVRVAATDQLSNSVSEVINKENGLEELPTEACQLKSSVEVREHSSKVATGQSESTKTDLHLLNKCKNKTTRSRRKLVKQAEDDVSNMHEGNLEKENDARPKRKRKAKVSKVVRNKSIEESTLSEDEFSVEDLISIANEYINSGKTRKGQRPLLAECESASLPRSISSENKTTQRDDTLSNESTLAASLSDLVECQPSERGSISFSSTGDFAQDMLELFLGTAIDRADEVKSNPEQVTKRVTQDYASTGEIQDGSVGDAVPLAKKKASFKDQVDLLLS